MLFLRKISSRYFSPDNSVFFSYSTHKAVTAECVLTDFSLPTFSGLVYLLCWLQTQNCIWLNRFHSAKLCSCKLSIRSSSELLTCAKFNDFAALFVFVFVISKKQTKKYKNQNQDPKHKKLLKSSPPSTPTPHLTRPST